MPSRGLAPQPIDYMPDGDWPDGDMVHGAPAEAALVAGISQRLRAAATGIPLRQLSTQTGVSVGTLSNLLAGKTWGDVVTIARLERALDVELWGGEHHGARIGAITAPRKKSSSTSAAKGSGR